ncbi:MAG: hypothetical protein HS116_02210 [Planctomycetes bacterium]|nr:hypothetical protein [Planctomycetota bacterium]
MSEPFGPWTLTDLEDKRLKAYTKLNDLISRRAAEHDQLFQRDKNEQRQVPQLYVNLPGLVCRAAADLVLSQPPTISAEDEAVQERIDALAARSKLHRLSWRSVYWTCALGDAYLTVADVPQGAQSAKQKPLPVLTLRRAIGTVARGVRAEDPPHLRQFLFRSKLGAVDLFTEHTAGAIQHYAYTGGTKAKLPEGYAERIETKEALPLVIHLAAWRERDEDEAFGESDFEGTEDLVFEVANRLRQIQRILDRHAEPPMNVPDGVLDETSQLAVRTRKVFERGVDGAGMEYVTWQSQLGEAYNEIDRLVKLISLMTETPAALWGMDEAGQAESGRALKFKLLSGLGKARRTGGMLREALIEAVNMALRREDVLAGKKPGEYEIEVALPETFIADEMDTADYIERMRRAQAMSARRAVELGQGLTGDDLEQEVAAIESEVAPPPVPGLEGGRF